MQLQEGESLATLAARYGVAEDDLQRWNPDPLAPGDAVVMFGASAPVALPEPEPSPVPSARPRRRRSRCKAQRTDVAEGSMRTAAGLSEGQIQRAVNKRLGRTRSCLPPGLSGTYEMVVDITVGCDGRVTNTYTIGRGALSKKTAACVERVFRGMRFPAHDMPDGQSFQYPLTFTL